MSRINQALIGILIAGITGFVQAQEAPIDYKCYVEGQKQQAVDLFSWQPSKKRAQMEGLIGTLNKTLDEQTFVIEKVIECVPISQRFTLYVAQKLDEATPQ